MSSYDPPKPFFRMNIKELVKYNNKCVKMDAKKNKERKPDKHNNHNKPIKRRKTRNRKNRRTRKKNKRTRITKKIVNFSPKKINRTLKI